MKKIIKTILTLGLVLSIFSCTKETNTVSPTSDIYQSERPNFKSHLPIKHVLKISDIPNISDLIIKDSLIQWSGDHYYSFSLSSDTGMFYVQLIKNPEVPYYIYYNGLLSFPTFTVLGFNTIDGNYYSGNIQYCSDPECCTMQDINGYKYVSGYSRSSVHSGDVVKVSWENVSNGIWSADTNIILK